MTLYPVVTTRNMAMARWTEHDRTLALTTVWDALHEYRENLIPPDYPDTSYDEQWDEICFATAIIEACID